MSVSTLSLVPTQAVVYAATNASSNSTGSSNSSSNSSSSSTASSGAVSYAMNPISWKYGVAIGALVASPFVLSLGF